MLNEKQLEFAKRIKAAKDAGTVIAIGNILEHELYGIQINLDKCYVLISVDRQRKAIEVYGENWYSDFMRDLNFILVSYFETIEFLMKSKMLYKQMKCGFHEIGDVEDDNENIIIMPDSYVIDCIPQYADFFYEAKLSFIDFANSGYVTHEEKEKKTQNIIQWTSITVAVLAGFIPFGYQVIKDIRDKPSQINGNIIIDSIKNINNLAIEAQISAIRKRQDSISLVLNNSFQKSSPKKSYRNKPNTPVPPLSRCCCCADSSAKR